MRFPAGTDPNRMPEKYRLRRHFDFDDGRKLRAIVRSTQAVTIFGTRAAFFGETNEIRAGGRKVDTVFLRGVELPYFEAIPLFAVETGRVFTEEEEKRAAQVVLLGADIADSLFPTVDPVGRTILLNGGSYEVLGVFAPDQGLFGMPSVNQFAIIPLQTYRKHYPNSKELFIAFTVPPDRNPAEVVNEVTDAFRRVRRIAASRESDFEVVSSDFLSQMWDQLTGAIVLLTGVISSIGLLVGGIGVMNIMLISVTERTKEIGVRKAIGARASDIRVQFLLEALTLTISGGLIGIALAAGVAWGVRTAAPAIPATLSPFWVMLGVVISAATGLFFGFYPANRAAQLDPIVCLRYE
jgi:putative ABC transport system permease protein